MAARLWRGGWPVVVALAAIAAVLGSTGAAFAPNDLMLCSYVHPDCLGNHWLLVWVAEQLLHGGSILHNYDYYWPVGDAPWLAGNGSEGIAFAPFYALFGWPLGSNVYLVSVLALNGVAGFALARAAGASPAASFAACTATSLSAYTLQELAAGRFSQVSICWLAFFLASWQRLLDAPSTGRAVVAGVMLAVASLFYWYYGFFGVIAGGILLVARGPSVRRSWRELAVFSATYLALMAPLVWVFARHWAGIPGTDEEHFPRPQAAGDSSWPAVPFLVESCRHSGRALPFSAVALAFAGLAHPRRRTAWGLFAAGVVFAGLMAGALIPGGPYELLYGLAEPLKRFWWPYRHVVVLNFAFTTLGALGFDRLFAGRRWAWPAGVALAASVPLQLELQRAPWHTQVSEVIAPEPFYDAVGKLPGKRMIEPPLDPSTASSETPLIYQVYHHKQLVNGHAQWVDRVRPPDWDAFIHANSFLSEMQALERAELDGTFTFKPEDLRALLDQDVRVMVLNSEYFPIALSPVVERYGAIFDVLFGEAKVTGKRARAWDMAEWNGQTSVAFSPFAWPAKVKRGGPELSILGVHDPSLGFRMPEPPKQQGPRQQLAPAAR